MIASTRTNALHNGEHSAGDAQRRASDVESDLMRAWALRTSIPAQSNAIVTSIENECANDPRVLAKAMLVRAAVEALFFREESATQLLARIGDSLTDAEPVWIARRQSLEARAARQRRDYDVATTMAQAVLALARAIDDSELIAGSIVQIVLNSIALGDHSAVPAFIEEARVAAARSGYTNLVSSIFLTEAAHHRALRDWQAAIACDLNAVEYCESVGDTLALGRALNNAATDYAHSGDLARAIDYGDRARVAFEASGDTVILVMQLNNLGSLCLQVGDYKTALDYILKCQEISERIGEVKSLASCASSLGTIWTRLREYVAASKHHEESLRLFESIGDRAGIASEYLRLGEVKETCGDYRGSLAMLANAQKIFEELSDDHGLATTLLCRAYALDSLGRYDEALATLVEPAAIYERHGEPHGIASAKRALGTVLVDAGQVDNGIVQIEQAREIAHAHGFTSLLILIEVELARAYECAGRFEEALNTLRSHYALKETTTSEQARRQFDLRETELARKDAEMERLKHVELAEALRQIEQAHRELKDAQTQLVHSEKMASLGQLTAGIAHEINNPVNFIRNSTSPLRRDLDEVRSIVSRAIEDEPEEFRERVTKRMAELDLDVVRAEIDALLRGIEDGASRTAEIVQGLRTFSRLDEDDMKPTDLIEGIESTLRLLGSRLGERITIVRAFDPIPLVDCRPGQINQVVMNLLSNAIDAIELDGEIRISTTCVNGEVSVVIADNGRGINPEHRDRLFEPFFTTKPAGKGTGLGLSISHSIVEAHRGRLDVESSPGAGSAFALVIPVGAL
ncbi:MAG: tetratricopeptide repeat protein [bacterium]|nr:tetratricopeptide repeat protein [Candidatus Kapabacteria bacterium]